MRPRTGCAARSGTGRAIARSRARPPRPRSRTVWAATWSPATCAPISSACASVSWSAGARMWPPIERATPPALATLRARAPCPPTNAAATWSSARSAAASGPSSARWPRFASTRGETACSASAIWSAAVRTASRPSAGSRVASPRWCAATTSSACCAGSPGRSHRPPTKPGAGARSAPARIGGGVRRSSACPARSRWTRPAGRSASCTRRPRTRRGPTRWGGSSVVSPRRSARRSWVSRRRARWRSETIWMRMGTAADLPELPMEVGEDLASAVRDYLSYPASAAAVRVAVNRRCSVSLASVVGPAMYRLARS